jgi:Mn-dependent DtxR family transcriptional regulator
MTVNSELVLNFLKKNYGKEFSKAEIADALGISIPAVTGTMNALVKNKLAENTREETVEVTPATETRKAVTKVVKYHTLTEAGLAYDPVAAEAEKLAAKEAAKAERAAARAAAKAAKEAAGE